MSSPLISNLNFLTSNLLVYQEYKAVKAANNKLDYDFVVKRGQFVLLKKSTWLIGQIWFQFQIFLGLIQVSPQARAAVHAKLARLKKESAIQKVLGQIINSNEVLNSESQQNAELSLKESISSSLVLSKKNQELEQELLQSKEEILTLKNEFKNKIISLEASSMEKMKLARKMILNLQKLLRASDEKNIELGNLLAEATEKNVILEKFCDSKTSYRRHAMPIDGGNFFSDPESYVESEDQDNLESRNFAKELDLENSEEECQSPR